MKKILKNKIKRKPLNRNNSKRTIARNNNESSKKTLNKKDLDKSLENLDGLGFAKKEIKKTKQKKYHRNTNQENTPKKNKYKKNINNNQSFNKKNKLEKVKISALPKDTLRIIPLGGCEEVGRNMTVFEHGKDIVIIDMGMQFPEEDQPGIDYIIPNVDYLKGKEKNIRGVIFTHGHLDHIGAAPILLDQLNYPLVVGSKLTVHMIKARQEDYKKGSVKKLKTKIILKTQDTLQLGCFKIKFFPVSHSIMDCVGVILESPNGTIIHPGDWQIPDPADKKNNFDFKILSRLKKPTVLMLESLGISYKTSPVPESEMYKNIESILKKAPGRIIIGTFASNVERVKHVLEMAKKLNKKVVIDGYSMKTNIKIAKELGYINFDFKNMVDINKINQLDDKQTVVICTGAQGEDKAVLNRIVNGNHRFIKFQKNDTVIFSSSIIPGNERSVQRLKDAIYRQCDNVIHSGIMDVHSGGHATANDIEKVIKDVNPTYFIPVYANHYMLKEAAKLAKERLNYTDKNVFVPDNGSVIEINKKTAKILNKKATTDPVFVDGLGVSDLQNIVLRDRQILSADGMVVVVTTVNKKTGKLIQNPDIISRGFVYLKENKELIRQIKQKIKNIVEPKKDSLPADVDILKNELRNKLGQFIYTKTQKRPMVLPVVIKI